MEDIAIEGLLRREAVEAWTHARREKVYCTESSGSERVAIELVRVYCTGKQWKRKETAELGALAEWKYWILSLGCCSAPSSRK